MLLIPSISPLTLHPTVQFHSQTTKPSEYVVIPASGERRGRGRWRGACAGGARRPGVAGAGWSEAARPAAARQDTRPE